MRFFSRKLQQIRKYNDYCVNGGGWSFEQWELNGSPKSPKHKKSKPEVTDRKSMPKAAPDEWPADCRIDAIGQNGGDGAHYDPVNQPTLDSKYHRTIKGVTMDVYDVLKAFEVTNPALQHLIKKALCCGLRGHKNQSQDLQDIIDSAARAKELSQDDE